MVMDEGVWEAACSLRAEVNDRPGDRGRESILESRRTAKKSHKPPDGQLLPNFQKRNSLNWIAYVVPASLLWLPGKIVEHVPRAIAREWVVRQEASKKRVRNESRRSRSPSEPPLAHGSSASG